MPAGTRRTPSREQRSARLEQIALDLFRRRGFDRVTVEEICGAAGVGAATFYRYFGTKEDVVFAYRGALTEALRTAIEPTADLPERARLTSIISEFARFLESQQEMLALRDQIVMGCPRLMPRTLTIQRDLEGVLADGLARLRGLPQPDGCARLEAGVGMLVLRMAFRSWRESGGSLPDAAGQARVLLHGLVCDRPPVGPAPEGGGDVPAADG